MLSLPTITPTPHRRLPDWLKRPLPAGNENFYTHHLIDELRLTTVCEEARCPNRAECWSRRTATFMIMGDKCTRRCPFCDVGHGRPDPLDVDEPLNLAKTIAALKLNYVVITSVDPDGAAADTGLQQGDVIQKVNGRDVASTGELRDALAKATESKPALLLVSRDGQSRFVTLSPPAA